MHVRVDEPGKDQFARGIDDLGARRHRQVLANRRDGVVLDEDVASRARFRGDDVAVPDQQWHGVILLHEKTLILPFDPPRAVLYHRTVTDRRWLRVLTTLLVAVSTARSPVPAQVPPAAESPSAFVDVVALDSSGRPVTGLGAADVRVSVDGLPRAVRSVRYVFRGPGAAAAAASLARSSGTSALAEPSRLLLLVVDENSISRGGEEAVVSAAWRVLDAVAATDRIAVVTVPVPRAGATLSSNRQAVRLALASLTGRASASRDLVRADQLRPGEPEPQVIDDDPEPSRDRPIAGRPPQPPGAAPSPGPDEATRIGEAAEPGDVTRTSLQALSLLLADLTEIPGPKTVVYLYGGAPGGDARDQARRDRAAVVAAAASSRTSIHVVSLARARSETESELGQVARDTGAAFVRWKGKDRKIDALSAALSGSYLVEIEGHPDDHDVRPRAVVVTTPRKGVTVLTAARWVSRNDPLPMLVEPPAAAPTSATPGGAAGATPAAGGPTSARATRPDPDLDAVLVRMSEYLDTYLQEFSDVVAEEDYYQRVMAWNNRPREVVRLRSDLLLVRTGDREGWVPFRDVFEVNDVPVRDCEDRLRKLFLERPGAAMAEARRITEESARHNIGPIERTVNLPTLPLLFLGPAHLPAFRFERHGEDTVEGLRVLRIDYEEVGRPTVIRDGTGRSRPSTGSLWVDPTTGRVVKTTLRNGDPVTPARCHGRVSTQRDAGPLGAGRNDGDVPDAHPPRDGHGRCEVHELPAVQGRDRRDDQHAEAAAPRLIRASGDLHDLPGAREVEIGVALHLGPERLVRGVVLHARLELAHAARGVLQDDPVEIAGQIREHAEPVGKRRHGGGVLQLGRERAGLSRLGDEAIADDDHGGLPRWKRRARRASAQCGRASCRIGMCVLAGILPYRLATGRGPCGRPSSLKCTSSVWRSVRGPGRPSLSRSPDRR